MNALSSYEIVSDQLRDLALLSNHSHTVDLEARNEANAQATALNDRLQSEIEAHRETRRQLDQCKTKLNFALGEIDVLNRRLKETEVDFTQKCGEVEDRVAIELEEKISLATKCEELASRCRKQEASLREKDSVIDDLKRRGMKERETYKRKIEDMEVKMQQEVYIAQTNRKGKGKGK
ncbi:spermatogenesis-associated protein 24-like [Oscarella lobularis]|uniref:spermatogenesis-associated protein 24-like n=1 Tax=Oscarella lobularis TaxID=121494 RepID=UPI0033144F0C